MANFSDKFSVKGESSILFLHCALTLSLELMTSSTISYVIYISVLICAILLYAFIPRRNDFLSATILFVSGCFGAKGLATMFTKGDAALSHLYLSTENLFLFFSFYFSSSLIAHFLFARIVISETPKRSDLKTVSFNEIDIENGAD